MLVALNDNDIVPEQQQDLIPYKRVGSLTGTGRVQENAGEM